MFDQFFEIDDPWTGPVINLVNADLDHRVYFTSTDNWISEYHGKLYFYVTQTSSTTVRFRLSLLDSADNEIVADYHENFEQGVLRVEEIQFPLGSHIVSRVMLQVFTEVGVDFNISDIKNDNIQASDFWTGFKGLEEILE